MKSEISGEAIHQALLFLQRKTLWLRTEVSSPVNRVEALFCALVPDQRELTPTDIGKVLNISPVQVSRLIKPLMEKGYLAIKSHPSDGRSRVLGFTDSGRDLLLRIDLLTNYIASRILDGLSEDQAGALNSVLKEIISALGSTGIPQREAQLPLASLLTEVTKALGMFGTNYMHSGMEVSRYHLLFELLRHELPVHFAELRKIFPMSQAALSRQLDELESTQMTSRNQSASDKRITLVSLTAAGRHKFEAIHASLGYEYARLVAGMPTSTKTDFLRGIAAINSNFVLTIPQSELKISVCKTAPQHARARKFLVENLVQMDSHSNLPSSILPPDHTCLSIELDGVMVAVAEIEYEKCAASLRFLVANPHATITAHSIINKLVEFNQMMSKKSELRLTGAICAPWQAGELRSALNKHSHK